MYKITTLIIKIQLRTENHLMCHVQSRTRTKRKKEELYCNFILISLFSGSNRSSMRVKQSVDENSSENNTFQDNTSGPFSAVHFKHAVK